MQDVIRLQAAKVPGNLNSVASGLAENPRKPVLRRDKHPAPRKEVNECAECDTCLMLSVSLGMPCSFWWSK